MTTDFRAAFEELVDAVKYGDTSELAAAMKAARAALAAEPVQVPEGPADDDIEALHQAVFASRLQGPPPNTSFEVDLVRAALARWGHAPNA